MKKQINEIKRMQLLAGVITESEYRESLINEATVNFDELKKHQETIRKEQDYLLDVTKKLGVDNKLVGNFNQSLNALIDAIFKAEEVNESSLNEAEAPSDIKTFLLGMMDSFSEGNDNEYPAGKHMEFKYEEEYGDEDLYGEKTAKLFNKAKSFLSKSGPVTIQDTFAGQPLDLTFSVDGGDIKMEWIEPAINESSLNEAEKGNMITQNDIDTLHDKGFDIITDKDWDFVRIQKMLFAPKADWRFLNNLLSSRNISADMDYYRGDGDKGRRKELEISKEYFDTNLKYPPLGSKLK